MAAVTAGPSNTPVVLIPNTLPQNSGYKDHFILSTQDLNNNNAPISEGYVVSGPVSQGISPIFIEGGKKALIPLSTASGNGAPYLKIWFPTNGGNTVYITYCVANSFMADGYYDYTTGVPATYFNALRTWINTNPSTGQAYTNVLPQVHTRTLKFSAYGALTNKPQNAVTFYLKYTGTFSAGIPAGNEVVLGGIVGGVGFAKSLS